MDYIVRNLHTIPRSYPSQQNGQDIKFAPGEQKEVSTKPPRSQGNWLVEAVEETEKPEDIENTANIEEGGDNE